MLLEATGLTRTVSKPDHPSDSEAAQHVGQGAEYERPRELEDWLNFNVYHPLSSRLARFLAPSRITPNVVSLAGGACVIVAAISYATPGWPLPAIVGLGFHLVWHVLDGADGDLARLTGKAGPLGELIDGLSDYLSHIVLYCVLATVLADQTSLQIAWLLAISAGFSRILQANFYEVQRRQYQWWVYAHPWLGEAHIDIMNIRAEPLRAAVRLYLLIAKMSGGMASKLGHHDLPFKGPAAEQERFKASVSRNFSPLLRPMGLLGANQRTLALGASMLAGSPIYFFLYEIVLLNIALIWSKRACVAAARNVAREMGMR